MAQTAPLASHQEMGTELTESRPHGPVIIKDRVDDPHRLHTVAPARTPLVALMVVQDLHGGHVD